MKTSKTVITTAVLSILLFFTGMLYSGELFDCFLPDMDNLEYQVTDVGNGFWILFVGVIFSLLPVCVVLIWRKGNIINPFKKIAVVFTIAGLTVLSLTARHLLLVAKFKILQNTFLNTSKIRYPLKEVYFEGFLAGGFIAGCMLAFFLFRGKKAV